jgi:hypothetical protein
MPGVEGVCDCGGCILLALFKRLNGAELALPFVFIVRPLLKPLLLPLLLRPPLVLFILLSKLLIV